MPTRLAAALRGFVPAVLAATVSTPLLVAQCATQVQSLSALPGTDGVVRISTSWDPDGGGPAAPRLVIGGTFTTVANVLATNIAVWDPASNSWSALGAGVNGAVNVLAAGPNGELFAAGDFTAAGGLAANHMARWDGSAWASLGSGSPQSGDVATATFLPNGDLVVGGTFTSIGGASANRVARWDGSAWSALGAGTSGAVVALKTLPNGDVVAGGAFATAGGLVVENIARWDGSSWSALGAGVGVFVKCLEILPSGDLVVGGLLNTAGGIAVSNAAVWNGTAWSAMGSPGFAIEAMAVRPNGEILVAQGDFYHQPPRISRWDGASWSVASLLENYARTLTTLPNGEVAVGGDFVQLGGLPAHCIGRWGGSWSAFGAGWSADSPALTKILALTEQPNGDIVAGGYFLSTPDGPANSVARWNGAAWTPMGGGFSSGVTALTTMSDGAVIAGGPFGVSRWNGAWSALGSGIQMSALSVVGEVLALPGGQLLVGGRFASAGGVSVNNIARWDGTAWSALGSGVSGTNAVVHAITTLPGGDVVVGGEFTSAGAVAVKGLARWNGASWSALGSGLGGAFVDVRALTVQSNGDLVVGGYFATAGGSPASHIARWNGTSWSAFASGTDYYVYSLLPLPNGDLLVGGAFTSAGGVPAPGLARWNGASWSAVGSSPMAPQYSPAVALLPARDGDVLVGGIFTSIGNVVTPCLARVATTCPASATTYGVGCAEANGPDVLTANNLPWMDATFRATGTGLPTVAIVLTLTSVTPIAKSAVPLTLAFPQAGIGCDVLTAPDLLGLIITTNGTAESQLFLPSSSPLIGLPFYHQLVSIEVDPQGAWTSVSATNALQLVAGSF